MMNSGLIKNKNHMIASTNIVDCFGCFIGKKHNTLPFPLHANSLAAYIWFSAPDALTIASILSQLPTSIVSHFLMIIVDWHGFTSC